jgi:hypothetical protein
MDQSKSAADDPAVFKEGIDLNGMGISGDIKVFWDPSQEKIPNASADEISYKSMSVKAVENFESLFVDILS